ncbi:MULTISPECIES: ABC transporter permease [Gordonia]|uniref:ABC transporter permease n=2 Tax=Gordonia TaxID=2053 RepID=A0ABP5US25_9ACTN|nr:MULTISPECIES: ABC transporter permease [Gordonia]AUH67267.1 ABC transporter [Gordonia sp. YC-JH1]KJR08534.1 ABC transporter [Gordonia sihwensis]KXT58343.1 ABC transporter [Gordonia sp. QH-12]MBY4568988.1 ABC transporter [Gordonia sihwensis]WFN93065.1 ABC transporter permease [Gordonia sihwensis]
MSLNSTLAASSVSTVYLRNDIRRVLRNRRAMIFTVAMPALLYLVFGATQKSSETVGSGNVAFYVLVGMALYGAVLAAASNAAAVSIEQQAGWTRTLMMTPLRPAGYVSTKVALALTMSALPVVLLAVVGAISGATAPVGVWAVCLVLAWLGSAVFAALGLALGSILKSDGAMQALGGVLALLAFAGNVFVPLNGTMLRIAEFTPMFGVVSLARYPLDHGVTVYGTPISLWVIIANIAFWAIAFAVAASYFYNRSTRRQ